MRLLPRSLFGRTLLVLASGLVLAELASQTVNFFDRGSGVYRLGAQETARHIAESARILNRLPAGLRGAVIDDAALIEALRAGRLGALGGRALVCVVEYAQQQGQRGVVATRQSSHRVDASLTDVGQAGRGHLAHALHHGEHVVARLRPSVVAALPTQQARAHDDRSGHGVPQTSEAPPEGRPRELSVPPSAA